MPFPLLLLFRKTKLRALREEQFAPGNAQRSQGLSPVFGNVPWARDIPELPIISYLLKIGNSRRSCATTRRVPTFAGVRSYQRNAPAFVRIKALSLLAVLSLSFLVGCRSNTPSSFNQNAKPYRLEVYFSPNGGCTDAIVREINKAEKEIFVQAYSFTSRPIGAALRSAKRKGLNVQVILDKSQLSAHYSSPDFFVHSEIPVRIDSLHAIAHNKIMIIDGHIVITGSFNFTRAAEERNAENLLILDDQALARVYYKNWQSHALHSPLYDRNREAP